MRKLYIFLSVFWLSVFSSCNEDFLNRSLLDEVDAAEYWKTPSDLELYVNQFYTSFPAWGGWDGGIFWFDSNSDNMTHYSVNNHLAGRTTIPASGSWSYGSIRSVNILLSKYQSVEAPFSEYQQFVGEGRFFRAYFYFNLVKNYGDVPWVDKPLNVDSEELYSNRTPRNELIDHILEDLDSAIAYMAPGANLGGNRLNQEIAQLFKSRVALYEGTWEKYHAGTPFGVDGSDGSKYFQIAAEAAEAVMNSGNYSVYSTGDPEKDYWHLFNQKDYSGNTEIMLWKRYNTDLGMSHNGQRYLARVGGGRGISKALVDSYLCTDGKPIAVSPDYQGDADLVAVVANRDARLQQTIYTPGDPMTVEGGEVTRAFEKSDLDATGESNCPTGYQIFKGADPDFEQHKGSYLSETGSIIFRYAEALLNFAEAKAELGTLSQGDLDKSINLLRARVNMSPLELSSITTDPNWDFPGLSPLLNEIRRERRVELAAEGYRYDDLMRWRAHALFVNKRIKGVKFNQSDFPDLDVHVDNDGYVDPLQTQIPNGFQFDPNRDYLRPISTQELTLNDHLTQNPGWEN
ncbi:RagB/SusD family nutrient uptake outer membrane protein [Rapidithrix thailandica]|uniref:RagB/SusD family nutrient uptake outer membrane protein n=1 Tax=Rapidithrix thailandica TaxID=413964 RepID=A0AAW9SAI7_9BACT